MGGCAELYFQGWRINLKIWEVFLLRSRGCARGALGKSKNGDNGGIFRQRQESHRLEDGNTLRDFWLCGRLVGQMAVRTTRIVRRIVAIEVANNDCRERQQREQRQRNPQDTNCAPKGHSG